MQFNLSALVPHWRSKVYKKLYWVLDHTCDNTPSFTNTTANQYYFVESRCSSQHNCIRFMLINCSKRNIIKESDIWIDFSIILCLKKLVKSKWMKRKQFGCQDLMYTISSNKKQLYLWRLSNALHYLRFIFVLFSSLSRGRHNKDLKWSMAGQLTASLFTLHN